jgi:3'-phosphoadenosine 5'-phosphosulfate (PAPS) 3'-phosphatase
MSSDEAYNENPKIGREMRAREEEMCKRAGWDGEFVWGSGVKCLKLIEREFDVYVTLDSGTRGWDMCGGHAMITALGGDCLALDQQTITYNDKLVMFDSFATSLNKDLITAACKAANK